MLTSLYVKSSLATQAVMNKCKSFAQDERGVTAVEYAIIAVAMSAIVLAVFSKTGLGGALNTAMDNVTSNIGHAKSISVK